MLDYIVCDLEEESKETGIGIHMNGGKQTFKFIVKIVRSKRHRNSCATLQSRRVISIELSKIVNRVETPVLVPGQERRGNKSNATETFRE